MFTWIMLERLHQSPEDMAAAMDLFIEIHDAEFLCYEIRGVAFDTKNDVPEIDRQILGICLFDEEGVE